MRIDGCEPWYVSGICRFHWIHLLRTHRNPRKVSKIHFFLSSLVPIRLSSRLRGTGCHRHLGRAPGEFQRQKCYLLQDLLSSCIVMPGLFHRTWNSQHEKDRGGHQKRTQHSWTKPQTGNEAKHDKIQIRQYHKSVSATHAMQGHAL